MHNFVMETIDKTKYKLLNSIEMKNLSKFFMAVAALFVAFACTTDVTEDLSVQLGGNAGQTTLSISLEESRTQLGEKAGDLYPVVWSEGDAIAINGVASAPLTAEQAGATAALFTCEGELARPYNVVYPAPAEGVTAAEGLYPVTFLANQNYVEGSFCEGAAPMYGYAAADSEGAIQLNHLTGVIRLAVKGEGVTLRNLTITSESGKLAGNFDLDCATGTLTAHEDATNAVTVSFGKGLTLKADEATPIYVAVPAGNYGKVTLMLNSTTDIMKLAFDSSAKPVTAGVVREFAEFTYEANASESETFLIDSKEALLQFAQIAANFAPYTTAKVTAPIDMTGEAWSAIEGFGAYIFDGGEFEIKGLTAPLFGATAATIKNVKLTDVAIEVTDLAKSGAIACELYDGSLLNCSAAGALHVNNTTLAPDSYTNLYNDIAHGGMVGYVSNATIYNCTNDVDITATSFCSEAKSIKVCFGGVVGGCANNSSFDTLINNGDVVYNGTTQSQNIYMSGIVGKENSASGERGIALLSNCTNNGELSTSKESVCGNAVLMSGITGAIPTTSDFICDKLVNSGAITHNGKGGGLSMSGIVSYNTTASFTNCSNSGDLKVSAGATITSLYMGGLFGQSIVSDKIASCTNSGSLTLEANATGGTTVHMGGIGAGVAEVTTISGCSNSGAISIADNANITAIRIAGIYAGTSLVVNGTMSDCHNTGNFSVGDNIKLTGTIAMSGVANWLTATKATPKVTNCTNKGSLTIGNITNENGTGNGQRLLTGGVFHSVSAGEISNCYNYAEGVTTVGTGKWTSRYMIGGLFGYIGQTGAIANQVITITDCQNYAAINVNPVGEIGTAQIGGLTSECYAAATDDIDQVLFERVHNSGAITVSGKYTSAGYPRLGGLLGICNMPTLELKECKNFGTITLKTTDSGQKKVGGIVGADTNKGTFKITNCENNGDIKVTTIVASLRLGGILASDDGANPTIISGSKNTGNFTIADQTATGNNYAIGGILGYSNYSGLTISGCTNGDATDATKGAITLAKAPGGSGVAGIAGYLAVAQTITSCTNYGTIKQQGDSANPRLGGIVGYHTTGNLTLDKCENHGAVVNDGIVSTILNLGGLVGLYGPSSTLTVKDSKNTGSVTCTSNQTTKSESLYVYRLGGIVGGSVGKVAISGCTNGAADDATKGAVTIGDAPTGVTLGGIVGLGESTITITTSKNYGDICQTGKGSCSKEFRAHLAGILGIGSSGNVTITDCENYGKVEYGTVKPNNRVDVAGITATTIAAGTNTISNCKNGGTIACMADSSAEICVAGIVGCPQGTTLVDNCTNLETAVIWGGGACSTNYDIGGILGGPSGAATELTNSKNYGLIKQSAVCSNNANVGGIAGYAYSIGLIDKCENYGALEIAGSTGSVFAGGIVGHMRHTAKTSKSVITNNVNYANLTFGGSGKTYAGGGAFGYIRVDANPKAELVIDNIYNLGNLVYSATATTPCFGGLAGTWTALAKITNSKCYCNIETNDRPAGWICGDARSETSYSENCAIGGILITEWDYTDLEPRPIGEQINEGNYTNYMYKSGADTDWTGTTNYDGCTLLSSKPTVEF